MNVNAPCEIRKARLFLSNRHIVVIAKSRTGFAMTVFLPLPLDGQCGYRQAEGGLKTLPYRTTITSTAVRPMGHTAAFLFVQETESNWDW